jgi:hypothetical protein
MSSRDDIEAAASERRTRALMYQGDPSSDDEPDVDSVDKGRGWEARAERRTRREGGGGGRKSRGSVESATEPKQGK